MRRLIRLSHSIASAALLLAACSKVAYAEPPAPAAAQTPALTPAQALTYVRAGDLHLSPDGSKLAYVAASYSWDVKGHVRVMDLVTGSERELTPPGKSERSPQWSPDGRTLAFLSNRDGKTQVYLVPADGGEPAAVTARVKGVDSFRWSPDGRKIAFVAPDDDAPPSDEGPQVADRESDLSHLWVLDLAAKTTRRLGEAGWRIDDIQWRDAATLLLVASEHPAADAFNDAVYSVAVAGGATAQVATPPQPFAGLTVSPDGGRFTLRSTVAEGPLERDLMLGASSGGAMHAVAGLPDLAVTSTHWQGPDVVWAQVADGFRNRLLRIGPDGKAAPIDLPLSTSGFDVSSRGDVVFQGEDFDHLPELYLRTRDGRIRQLGHLQKGWEGVRLAKASIFRTPSFDGTPIEAALLKPAARSPGKAPLVLLVHGGPSSNFAAGYGWEVAWGQLLAAHGYQVLLVNPRGSNGYSEAFLKANRGDWGGGDYKDLMAVLDAVIARGGVDPNRLGIGGWSYGGEMSAWAIGQSHRFKAAVVGAGVFDQEAEFETEAHPEGDEWYFGAPWDHPDLFARNSPATFIRNARTPTLVVDGEDDRSNPVGQSKGLYRALKHYGVETQMVLYPGEGHSPRKGSYNVDMFQRFLDWYDRHLR